MRRIPRAASPTTGKKAARPSARKVKADVLVDHGLCKACGVCVALCPARVFDTDADGRAVVARPGDCTACRLCEWHCPDFAIEVVVRGHPAAAPETSPEGGET